MKKTSFQVRTTVEERKRFHNAATHFGMTLSDAARTALSKLARKAEKEQADAADQSE